MERDYWQGKWIISVIIFGNENNKISLYVRQFKYSISADNILNVEMNEMNYSDDWESGLMFGEYEAIKKYINEEPEPMWSSLLDNAIGFIEIEVESGNPQVGYPIDLLMLTKNGSEWFTKTAP